MRTSISLLFCLLFFLCVASVSASAPAPADTCRVVGVVESVAFEAAQTWCKEPGIDCPTDGPTGRPDQYVYVVVVRSTTTVDDAEFPGRACDDLFPADAAVTILAPLSTADLVAAPGDVVTFFSVETVWGHVARGMVSVERMSGLADDWRPPRKTPLVLWSFVIGILIILVGSVLLVRRRTRR